VGDRREDSPIEVGMASSPLPGQSEIGDKSLVLPNGKRVLIGVIDGLGHGSEAAHAADLAVRSIRDHPGDSLEALVQQCHTALRRTRGVAITLASLDLPSASLSWLGIGNVEALLIPAQADGHRQVPLLSGGVVGHQLPRLRVSSHDVSPGDLIVLATDGIDRGFAEQVVDSETPQDIADALLQNCGKGTDDALVLVVRYLGTGQ
jgi:negative regulator of sigma-B (phosphoserine phosphatase)